MSDKDEEERIVLTKSEYLQLIRDNERLGEELIEARELLTVSEALKVYHEDNETKLVAVVTKARDILDGYLQHSLAPDA